jgi:tetratricopeptide (TPR) repeat protein
MKVTQDTMNQRNVAEKLQSEGDTMSKVSEILHILICFLILGLGTVIFPNQGLAGGEKRDLSIGERIVLAKAGRLMNSKAYDQAITLLTKFQAQNPSPTTLDESDSKGYQHAEIYYALGTCYLMQNDYRQAVETLELAVQQDPQHLSALLNLAKSYYELNDYTKAGKCFARAYDISPEKKPEYLYYSAVAFLLAKQYEPSITAFERLFSDHPKKIQLSWQENLVHALLSAGHGRRALSHIKQLAKQHRGEKKIQWQEILLQQYMQLGMQKEALAYTRALTEQAPTEAKWWKALASIYLQSGKYKPALTAMVLDSYLEPLSEQEAKLVADLYLQLGIPGKAAGMYQTLLSEKNSSHVIERLILSLRQLGQTEQALAVLEKFAPASKAPKLLMQKANLLYELGKYQAAAAVYRQTAEKDSQQKDRALQMAKYAMLQANYMDRNRHQQKQAMAF